MLLDNDYRISIHAPARGATKCLRFTYNPNLFQSTLPRGERQNYIFYNFKIFRNFNPRSREGSDFGSACLIIGINISIHAPARGATISFLSVLSTQALISIHAPARGATKSYQDKISAMGISIHAPARGATPLNVFTALCNSISIHAPARGATATLPI